MGLPWDALQGLIQKLPPTQPEGVSASMYRYASPIQRGAALVYHTIRPILEGDD